MGEQDQVRETDRIWVAWKRTTIIMNVISISLSLWQEWAVESTTS
jgi:hypothetical protein